MLKFIRGSKAGGATERIRSQQREFFGYHKSQSYGFPTKPTCMAYSKKLDLLAVGTKSGLIRVVGKTGVEFNGNIGKGNSEDSTNVLQIHFISKTAQGQGRLLVLCSDNSLHLLQLEEEYENRVLKNVKSISFEGKLKRITSLTVGAEEILAYVGTESGNIYSLDLVTFQLVEEKTIYMDVVLQSGPENYKVNPGAVERILEKTDDANLLIGYERGLIILWDLKEKKTSRSFVSSQQLEYLSWVNDFGENTHSQFVSSHNDGSHIIWDLDSPDTPTPNNNNVAHGSPTTTYGPYPCKRINKIEVHQNNEERTAVFSGGMPRSAYGDHYTVSYIKEKIESAQENGNATESGDQHVVFDLTSRVIDFALITAKDELLALVILAEEELICIDLKDPALPPFQLPYLHCLHPSAITCLYHTTVNISVIQELETIGQEMASSGKPYSKNNWPINGGTETIITEESNCEVLITGHEDGSIRIWNTSRSKLSLLCRYSSAYIFTNDEEIHRDESAVDEDEEEWPPFRKVGVFDPYSDDPRLAVKKIIFCPKTGFLAVGGTAGQVILLNVTPIAAEHRTTDREKLEVEICNLIGEKDGSFVWKGHSSLDYCNKERSSSEKLKVVSLIQVQPPASITTFAIEGAYGLLAIGTAHGFLLFDIFKRKVVMFKATLNPNDIMAAGDTPISRRKSIKKSLRESFRRLRKGRSQRYAGQQQQQQTRIGTAMQSPIESKPMERSVEARSTDDSMSSMVRTVSFSKTYIVSLQTMTYTLWVGTNAGTVFIYLISLSGGSTEKRHLTCTIGKEIQLRHAAPVLGIVVLDSNSVEINDFSTPSPASSAHHKVLIISEEQVKIFTLPSLKNWCKFKLTALDGSRIRKVHVSSFKSSVTPAYKEKCLVVFTNLGDLVVVNLPELKKVYDSYCIRREDISAISSLVLTVNGEAFYMSSASELQRVSLSSRKSQSKITDQFQDGLRLHKNQDNSTQDNADVTIDSIRDHTLTHNAGASASGSPTGVVTGVTNVINEERHPTIAEENPNVSATSSNGNSATTNQIITVTTTTVVNSSLQGGTEAYSIGTTSLTGTGPVVFQTENQHTEYHETRID